MCNPLAGYQSIKDGRTARRTAGKKIIPVFFIRGLAQIFPRHAPLRLSAICAHLRQSADKTPSVN
jgi:hypothetical protein